MNGTADAVLAIESGFIGREYDDTWVWQALGLPGMVGEPSCAAFQTMCLHMGGVPTPVDLSNPYYCPNWVAWGQAHGRWATTPARGRLVLFDWGNSGTADHVGMVEFVDAAGVHTIEGNSDALNGTNRAVHTDQMLGFVEPPYAAAPAPVNIPVAAPWLADLAKVIAAAKLTTITLGSSGLPAAVLARQLAAKGLLPNVPPWSNAGPAFTLDKLAWQALMEFQAEHHLAIDGKCGPQTWQALFA